MSRTGALIFLGVLVILTPFSGLPIAIRSMLAVIFGACVLGIGLSLRVRQQPSPRSSAEVSTPEPAPPQSISPI